MTSIRDRVTIDVAGGVAQVALARPEKRNALDPAMFQAIAEAVEHLRDLAGLRAVVLSGAGRGFCAGIDTGALAAAVDAPLALDVPTHGAANVFQQAAWGWHTLPVPVIAAVHGVAFGGGFQIMLGADVRIVAPDARLSIMEIRYGLVPDMAGIARMTRLAREDLVRELTFTGREFSGEDAVRWGFASRTHDDPLAEATRLAAEIAEKSPDAIRAAKRLLNLAADPTAETILAREAAEQAALMKAPNHLEAVASVMQRRRPQFSDG